MYTQGEVMEFVKNGDVRFIRLAFADAFGCPKNISILPEELDRAFSEGISFDASAVRGFGGEEKSDLFLYPDPGTLSLLPWRTSRGRVVRLLCDIRYPDGSAFACDTRGLLKRTIAKAEKKGVRVNVGTEFEFYLFRLDEAGNPTQTPMDEAGYMDLYPLDRGENIRREVCLTLSEMGIQPESSHHEEGPGQNEIDFRFSDALTAADNALTFKTVVRTVAMQSGLYADFSPKPLPGCPGNGLHVNLSIAAAEEKQNMGQFMAGLLAHISACTAFLNPQQASYARFGEFKAPRYITWSPENRSQLIRIPAAHSEQYRRIELRSPDPECDPYLAFALLLEAGMDGMDRGLTPPKANNGNLYAVAAKVAEGLPALPASLEEARRSAGGSALISRILSEDLLRAYAIPQG